MMANGLGPRLEARMVRAQIGKRRAAACMFAITRSSAIRCTLAGYRYPTVAAESFDSHCNNRLFASEVKLLEKNYARYYADRTGTII